MSGAGLCAYLTEAGTAPGRYRVRDTAARSMHKNIIVICGCMFAGKTTRLIERVEDAQRNGRRVRTFKHALDDRYDAQQLSTHDGRTLDAVAAQDVETILHESDEADVIAIDEAHFFGKPLIAVCDKLTAKGLELLVVGIDHDAWGQPIPPLPQLKPMAQEVELLHASCSVCGAPARFSQRMIPLSDDDMVGGPGEYEPRCEAHFVPLPAPAPVY